MVKYLVTFNYHIIIVKENTGSYRPYPFHAPDFLVVKCILFQIWDSKVTPMKGGVDYDGQCNKLNRPVFTPKQVLVNESHQSVAVLVIAPQWGSAVT